MTAHTFKSLLSLAAVLFVIQLTVRGCWKIVAALVRLTIDLIRATVKTITRRKV